MSTETNIVGVTLRRPGRVRYYDAKNFTLRVEDLVVVESEADKNSQEVGTVVVAPRPHTNSRRRLPQVIRRANNRDAEQYKKVRSREEDLLDVAKAEIIALRLPMKVVGAEQDLVGGKLILFFTAEGRIDFRSLVKTLAEKFKTRIEMRQIGVRDEAKKVGGIGVCGLTLCCCTFLKEFAPVSIKMAKAQNLSLNPSKISGQCGRLLCCLGYEHENYLALTKTLPKIGKVVNTPQGSGKVKAVSVLKQEFLLILEDGTDVRLSADDWMKMNPPDKAPEPEVDEAETDGEIAKLADEEVAYQVEEAGDFLTAEATPPEATTSSDTDDEGSSNAPAGDSEGSASM